MKESKNNLPATISQVFDSESGIVIDVPKEMQNRAQYLLSCINGATLLVSVALAEFADNKLFLGLGYSSFKDFAENRLGFSYRMAKNYLQVGRRFGDALGLRAGGLSAPDVKGEPVSRLKGPDGPESTSPKGEPVSRLKGPDSLEQFSGLGIKKLLNLARVEDAVFEDLIENKELTAADGTVYDLDQIKAMKSAEFVALVKQKKDGDKAYQSKISQLDAEVEKLKSEQKYSEKDRAENERLTQENNYYAARFEADKLSISKKSKALEEAGKSILNAIEIVSGIKVEPEDPEAHHQLIISNFRYAERLKTILRLNAEEVIVMNHETETPLSAPRPTLVSLSDLHEKESE